MKAAYLVGGEYQRASGPTVSWCKQPKTQAKTHADSSAELADNPMYLPNRTGKPALYIGDSRLSIP